MATEARLESERAGRWAAAAEGLRAWRGPLLLGFGTVLALRIVLSAWGAFVMATAPPADLAQHYAFTGYPLQTGGLAAPWEREDAIWYEKIAAQGYTTDPFTRVFFPFLPILIRLASPLTGGNFALAGLLVAALASAGAFAILYRLVTRDHGSTVAGRTVAYLAIFPMAFFLYSTFTEPVFLLLVLGAFWAGGRGRWYLAAALAFCAGLTKVQGAVLGLPLLVEYCLLAGWRPADWRRPSMLLAILRRRPGAVAAVTLGGAAGTAAFFGYMAGVVRDPLSYSEHQLLIWHQRITWPGETLWVAVRKVLSMPAININAFDLVVLLLFTALTVAAFRQRLSYGVYAATILAFSWVHVNEEFPLMSISRFVLVAFPCYLVLALWALARPRWVHLVLVSLSLAWMAVWAMIFIQAHWVA